MAQQRSTGKREKYYEELLEGAESPKERFEVLRSRFLADVKRLPDGLRDGAYASAADALKGVIEAVGDAIEDIRPVNA
jgi:hypothetical protein